MNAEPVTPEFVEELPPPGRGRPRVIEPLVKDLQARPGQWAVVQREPKGKGSKLAGRMVHLKAKGCETHQRTVDDEVLLFARWPA